MVCLADEHSPLGKERHVLVWEQWICVRGPSIKDVVRKEGRRVDQKIHRLMFHGKRGCETLWVQKRDKILRTSFVDGP